MCSRQNGQTCWIGNSAAGGQCAEATPNTNSRRHGLQRNFEKRSGVSFALLKTIDRDAVAGISGMLADGIAE